MIGLGGQEKLSQYTWHELLSKWPEEAYHPLVDVQPEYEPADWHRLCPISDVTPQQWQKGVPASHFLPETDLKVLAFWQGERLSESQRTQLKNEKQGLTIWCFTVVADYIVYVAQPVVSMVNQHPRFFCSRDLQTVRIFAGLMLEWAPLREVRMKEEKKEEVIYVFFVSSGPLSSQVKSFQGDPQSVQYRLMVEERLWAVCSRFLAPAIGIESPISLRVTWLQATYKVAEKIDFLSQDYYKVNLNSYSAWSFSIHQKQVAQALSHLPNDSVIVAPGDGIGVCASIWKGRVAVVSGDVAVSQDNPLVRVESFLETVQRGQVMGGDRAVLLLSYLYSLLTEEERRSVEQWEGPIIVIDSKDFPPFPDCEHIGPGVFVKNYYYEKPEITVMEGMTTLAPMLYSENLLRLEEIFWIEENSAVQYWHVMRPLKEKNVEGVPVVYSLSEYFRYKEIYHEFPYVAVIGKIVYAEFPACFHLRTSLSTRMIYYVSEEHEMVESLKRHAHWTVNKRRFYFCFTGPTEWDWQPYPTSQTLFRVSAGQAKIRSKAAKLLGVMNGMAWVRTIFGLQAFDVSSLLTRRLLLDYLDEFGSQEVAHLTLGATSLASFPAGDSASWGGQEKEILDRYVGVAHLLVQRDAYFNPLGWKYKDGRRFEEKLAGYDLMTTYMVSK